MASLSEIVLSKSFDTDNSLNAFQQTLGTGLKAAALAAEVEKTKAETQKNKNALNAAKFNQLSNRMSTILKTKNPKIRKVLIDKYNDTATSLGVLGINEENAIRLLDDEDYQKKVLEGNSLAKQLFGKNEELDNAIVEGFGNVFADVESSKQLDAFLDVGKEGLQAEREQTKLDRAAEKRFTDTALKLNKDAAARFEKPETSKQALREAALGLQQLKGMIQAQGESAVNTEQARTLFQTIGVAIARSVQKGALSDKDLMPFLNAAGFQGRLEDLANFLVTAKVNPDKIDGLLSVTSNIAQVLDDKVSKKLAQFRAQSNFKEFEGRQDELERKIGLDHFASPTLTGEFALPGAGKPQKAITPMDVIRRANSVEDALKQLEQNFPTILKDGVSPELRRQIQLEIQKQGQRKPGAVEGQGQSVQPFPVLAPGFEGEI